MSDPDRLTRFLRTKANDAGRQYEEARRAFTRARKDATGGGDAGTPTTARIVCRRYAERREVTLDTEGRPDCFDAGHPDCDGCVEDIQAGQIERW